MPTIGGGLSPEGSGSKSFPVPGEQGMYGVPGISPDTFPSPTSFTSSGTFDNFPVNQADNQRRKVSATNPTPFTSTQPTLGEGDALDRQSIKPVPTNDTTQASLGSYSNPTNELNQFSLIEEITKAVQIQHFLSDMTEVHALAPERELTNQTEWKQWLERNIEGFAGNMDNAAALMAAFTEGKAYIYENLTSRGLTSFERPHTAFIFQSSLMPSPFAEVNKGHDIFVKDLFLVQASTYDMQEIVTIISHDFRVSFQGTLPDFFRISGLEETHHAAFEQIKKNAKSGILPFSTSMAEYDAQEHEYRALRWQVRFAEERHTAGLMPIETVNVLKDRLAAAKLVRTNSDKKQGINQQNQLSHEQTEQLTAVHPSETFPWLDRDSYFQQRDAFVADHLEEAKNMLQSDPDFSLRDNPQLTHDTAVLLMRATFVINYLAQHDAIKSSNVSLGLETWQIANNETVAVTEPHFYRGEDLLIHFGDTNPADSDEIELRGIKVGINFNRLEQKIIEIETAPKFEKPEGGIDLTETEKEQYGICMEYAMLEEMSEVLYILDAAKSKDGMRRLIKEFNRYPQISFDENVPITREAYDAYLNSNIERNSDIWGKAFMQRYYPELFVNPIIVFNDLLDIMWRLQG